jgi:hypothetical protein
LAATFGAPSTRRSSSRSLRFLFGEQRIFEMVVGGCGWVWAGLSILVRLAHGIDPPDDDDSYLRLTGAVQQAAHALALAAAHPDGENAWASFSVARAFDDAGKIARRIG